VQLLAVSVSVFFASNLSCVILLLSVRGIVLVVRFSVVSWLSLYVYVDLSYVFPRHCARLHVEYYNVHRDSSC
jgi:hypothetical protein